MEGHRPRMGVPRKRHRDRSLTWVGGETRMRGYGGPRFVDWSDGFSLSNTGKAGRRRDGGGVQGRGYPATPILGAEVLAGGCGGGRAGTGAVSAGGAGGVGAEPSEYLHDL